MSVRYVLIDGCGDDRLNVCVCDTKERAQELADEYHLSIEELPGPDGLTVTEYLDLSVELYRTGTQIDGDVREYKYYEFDAPDELYRSEGSVWDTPKTHWSDHRKYVTVHGWDHDAVRSKFASLVKEAKAELDA